MSSASGRKPVALFLLLQCTGLLQLSYLAVDANKIGSWKYLSSWLESHGALVHGGLELNASCEATGMRGVITTSPIAANTMLFRIPQELWVRGHMFATKSIDDQKIRDLLKDEEIRLALALALKAKRGNSSAYSTYISMLPEHTNFHAFHPVSADRSTIADFRELRIIGVLERARIIATNETKHMFKVWKSTNDSRVLQIAWNEMEAALNLVRTRSIRLPEGGLALVPLYDLINTASDNQINAAWTFEKGALSMRSTTELPSNTEILTSYGSAYDNELMLHTWGLYLDRNPARPISAIPTRCLATWDPVDKPLTTATSLREATEVVLDLRAAEESLLAGWNSPPCKKVLPFAGQVQLRCSLARLAWETCAAAWGFEGWEMQAATARSNIPSVDKHVSAHLEIGGALAKKGDRQGSMKQWQTVMDLQPLKNGMLGIASHGAKDLVARVYVSLGKLMAAEGDPNSGASQFQAALQADPGNKEAQTLLQQTVK